MRINDVSLIIFILTKMDTLLIDGEEYVRVEPNKLSTNMSFFLIVKTITM